ncbi:DUF6410 domain-containing protein [Nocardiopsis flavescens]|uniref:DUF6410 domain-containing protein n=1 Tax=Nocardiopsis flavescens TaxID=758803 RepID=UPI0036DC4F9F
MTRTDATTSTAAGTAGAPVIGRDLPPLGRAFRIVAGVCGLLLLGFRIPWDGDPGAHLGMASLYLVLIAAAYVGVFGLARGPLSRGLGPWIPAGVLQAPVLIYPFGLGSGPLHDALAAYTAGSLLLNAAIGYAGLEVAALPSLVWRRRYAIYSPFNAVDLAETALARRTGDRDGALRWARVPAALATAFVFVAFWLVDYVAFMPFLPEGAGEAMRLPGALAWVLLAPAALLAWEARRRRDRLTGAAALVLALLTPMFVVDMVPEVLWMAVIGGGLVAAVAAAVRWAAGARRARRAP